jgi:YidC/Oxa1 family membrane protein insertase
VQLPIFFSLFRVLRDPEKYVPTSSSLYHALCDGVGKVCDSDTINHLTFLGMDLQLSATDAHKDALDAAPYFILVGLVVLTGFLQTRQAQKRTPAANKQMGMVMRVLPVFFGLISLSFPAGLVLYFFVSNLWRLGQQEVIFRRHGSAVHPPRKERAVGKAGAIDAESRVVDDDVEDAEVVEDEAPKPILPAKKPVPKAAADTTDASPAPPPKATGKATGGLRGLFQLPPPPDGGGGNGGRAAPSSSRPATASAGSGGNPRPPQQRSRSKKKKRKR